MSRAWKVRAADLRRIAAETAEPERERKMLVLADQLEEADARVQDEDRKETNGR